MDRELPRLDRAALADTRNTLHAYTRVLGGWLTSCRAERKHWWQASLRPSLKGLTTGVVYAEPAFELELNLVDNVLIARTAEGAELSEALAGQPAGELGQRIRDFLTGSGLDTRLVPEDAGQPEGPIASDGYSAECASAIAGAWRAVAGMLEEFQAGIREESGAIQIWPHHFDLAMTWLPGDKVPGQDPANAAYADKQMGFGFSLGDAAIPEPYFYATAYPLPEALPATPLPAGAVWHTEGFQGAVVRYQDLADNHDPRGYLLDLWRGLLSAGRVAMNK